MFLEKLYSSEFFSKAFIFKRPGWNSSSKKITSRAYQLSSAVKPCYQAVLASSAFKQCSQAVLSSSARKLINGQGHLKGLELVVEDVNSLLLATGQAEGHLGGRLEVLHLDDAKVDRLAAVLHRDRVGGSVFGVPLRRPDEGELLRAELELRRLEAVLQRAAEQVT